MSERVSSCAAEAVHPRAMREIERGRHGIASRIRELTALTEREVLGAGDALSCLLDKAREIVSESDNRAAESLARAEEIMSRFISDLQEDIRAQGAAVQQVLDLADGIEKAVDSIERVTQSSNILAVNIAIEAARAGDQGRGFAVIATQMRELSDNIEKSAESVAKSIDGMRAGLPPIMKRATSIDERTRAFVDEVSQHVKAASLQTASGGSAQNRLDPVLQLSNVALSHLQFHDPLVQQLTQVTRDLEQLETRVRHVLDGQAVDAIEKNETAIRGAPAGARGGLVLF